MPLNTPEKSFRIKHDDDRFITKLTKENPDSNSSFRVYYKDFSGAVPFTWETRPGTPKHRFHHNPDIPPLTPPPSYYTAANPTNSGASASKSKVFLHALLRNIKPHVAKSPSRSFREPNVRNPNRQRRFASWGSDERPPDVGKKERLFHGYSSSVGFVKKAFLSIVGHRSASGTRD